MSKVTRREVLQGVAAAASAPLTALTANAAATGPASAPARSGTPPAPLAATDTTARERTLLDFDWRFQFGHAADPAKDFGFGLQQSTYAKAGAGTADAAFADFKDEAWQSVNLPHDWAVALPFAPSDFVPGVDADGRPTEDPRAAHGFKPLGRAFPATSVGWYRRAFEIPAADLGRRISVEFDGVFRDCTVFCNGYVVGRNQSGYAPFRVDLTDFLNYGASNLLAVRVDASLGEGWFYEGAGIYRHVWLVKTHALHIPQWGSYARAALKGGAATLELGTELRNDGDTVQDCAVEFVVLAPDGRVAARVHSAGQRVAPDQTRAVQHTLQLAQPRLWSLETPHLYTLECQVIAGGARVDAQRTRFGIRSIRFDPARGFLLNDKPVKLQGTCNHQDHAGVGVALPDRLQAWRIEKLKEMGCNAYRTAHNPPAPELLDTCDALGVLVLDETRSMSSDEEGLSQLTRMVRRDRNHPSVILWSLGNEEPQQGTARGARVVRTMKQLAKQLDPTRPCIIAMDNHQGEGAGAVVDVLGFNYRTEKMGAYHERFPNQPVLGTETGSTVGTRGIYVRDDAKGQVRAYDVDYPWWASTAASWWDYVERRAFIAGGFVWTGFDYRGEPTPYNRWPSISSQFGIMDTCGFPKDNYYYYQAQWTREPVLHLFPHWNWPTAGETVDVWCHTNLERVELFLNGNALGSREVPRNGHVEWRVPYVAGVLEARGYRNEQLALTARRETTGAPARIALRPDRTTLRADGRDLCMVTVEIQDAMGRAMPVADNLVQFAVQGPGRILGVGNGDPNSLEPDQATQRRAFNGLAQVIVQGSREAGSIRLEAVAAGLAGAQIVLETRLG